MRASPRLKVEETHSALLVPVKQPGSTKIFVCGRYIFLEPACWEKAEWHRWWVNAQTANLNNVMLQQAMTLAMEFYPRENNFTLELPVTNIMSDIGRQCWDTLDGNIGVMLLKIAHLGAGGQVPHPHRHIEAPWDQHTTLSKDAIDPPPIPVKCCCLSACLRFWQKEFAKNCGIFAKKDQFWKGGIF